MKRAFILLYVLLPLLLINGLAQAPAGFSWISLATDKATVAIVRHALKPGSYDRIRRIGVEEGFAIVLTTSKESDPQTDHWSIYNLTLATGKARKLLSGYRVKEVGWVGQASPELEVTYLDCWGCEAATIFTTIHFTEGQGWSARWPDNKSVPDDPQAGAVVSYGDAGEPYDDDVVDQIFAVVPHPEGSFAVGSWFHSRNSKTGKIDANDVVRYSVDPATGNDRVEKLVGAAALDWERRICAQPSSPSGPNIGQSSKTCQRVLKDQSQTKAPSK
jgi:hypothetical protein